MTEQRLAAVDQMLDELEAEYCLIVGVGFAKAALQAGQQDGEDAVAAAREARRCLSATVENNDGLPDDEEVRGTLIDAQQALVPVLEVSG